MTEAFAISIEPFVSRARLEPEWRALEARAAADFFVSWGWVDCWLKRLPSGSRPFVLRVRNREDRDNARAMALICPNRVRRRGGLISAKAGFFRETGDQAFDLITPEGAPLLAARGFEDQACKAMLRVFDDPRFAWDELVLRHIPHEWAAQITAAARASGLLVASELSDRTYWIPLSELPSDYVGVLSANTRWQIRRTERLYRERWGALQVDEAGTPEDARAAFEQLKALHADAWRRKGRRGAFDEPSFEAFHRHLIKDRLSEGEIQLLSFRAGDHLFAVLYNFRFHDRVYAYQSGLEFLDDNRFKPGLLAHRLAVEHNRRAGLKIYDFLGGAYQYKESLATKRASICSLKVQRPRLLFRMEGAVSTVKNTASRLVAPKPRKPMRQKPKSRPAGAARRQ